MGELARKPGCPEIAETPLELLTPRPGEGFSLVDKTVLPALGVIGGVITVITANVIRKRPAWAGIHMHILSAGIGYGIGTFIRNTKMAAKAERDAVLKHYMSLHPEDFPPFERKRFKDVYYTFVPLR